VVESTVRAVVVFDDEQQLDWPRSALPAAVQPGMAVVVRLISTAVAEVGLRADAEAGSRPAGQAVAGWQGEVTAHSPTGGWLIRLPGGQQLRWPDTPELAAQSGAPVSLQLTPDLEDTQSRRRQVTRLLDDIFGNPA
jgi:hypothetical protein